MSPFPRQTYRLLLPVMLIFLAGAACNLLTERGGTVAAPTPTSGGSAIATRVIASSSEPVVAVLWPPGGSEFAVRQEVTVHVRATDSQGITRIELRSPDAMLSSVPSPERNGQPTMEAILSWRPSRAGTQDLEVVAYRGRVASSPVPLTLQIRQRSAEIMATPVPYGLASAGIVQQPGAACQVRVNIDNLRLRSGPGTGYQVLGFLNLGEVLQVTGQDGARAWYQVSRNGQTAWMSASPDYSTQLTNCSGAPIVQ